MKQITKTVLYFFLLASIACTNTTTPNLNQKIDDIKESAEKSPLTLDESCDYIRDYYDSLYDIEIIYLNIQHQTVDIWNSFIDVENTDEYIELYSEEQKKLHKELGLYGIVDHLKDNERIISSLNNTTINVEEIHVDHNNMLYILREFKNDQLSSSENLKHVLLLYIEFIEEIEIYYEKWDSAYEEGNETLVFVLEENFEEFRSIHIDTLDNFYEKEEIETANFQPLINEFYDIAYENCGTTFKD